MDLTVYRFTDFLPRLRALADVPLKSDSILQACCSHGWVASTPSHLGIDLFEVESDYWPAPLMALFTDESTVALPLYVLMDEFEEEHPYFCRSRAEYDQAFACVAAAAADLLGPPQRSGIYRRPNENDPYQYSVWTGEYSHFVVVQHFEGDAHTGSQASIDIRILARDGEAPLAFPLQTDLIF